MPAGLAFDPEEPDNSQCDSHVLCEAQRGAVSDPEQAPSPAEATLGPHTLVSLMTRLLLSPDFSREKTQLLAEEILRRHGIGVTGSRVAASFSRSLPG